MAAVLLLGAQLGKARPQHLKYPKPSCPATRETPAATPFSRTRNAYSWAFVGLHVQIARRTQYVRRLTYPAIAADPRWLWLAKRPAQGEGKDRHDCDTLLAFFNELAIGTVIIRAIITWEVPEQAAVFQASTMGEKLSTTPSSGVFVTISMWQIF